MLRTGHQHRAGANVCAGSPQTKTLSALRIPHYSKRSAIESRFAMCAFTDIAIQRGFDVWIVSNWSITDDVARVGFLKSNGEDAAKLLGKDFVGDNVLRTEVQVINRMCGIERAK